MNFRLEICCGSADDVFAAAEAGADRVELNSALFLGGLSPSIGLVREAKKAGIPMMVMVRPRDGGFCYTDREFSAMLEDLRAFVSEDVEGVVFGILRPDGSVDRDRCRLLCEAAGDRIKVFHRAFDVVPDWKKAMDELIELGFNRILTSGQAPNCGLGAETIREMQEYARGRIEILPGGGLRPHNINDILKITGCTQAHASAGAKHKDYSCSANPNVHFGPMPGVPEDEYSITEPGKVKALLDAVKI